jgi:hypothetical protein
MDDVVQKGLANKRESKYVEFKEAFDPGSAEAWCELIKDIIAISNTGGGVIIIGLSSTGGPSGKDIAPVLGLDPATVTDRIHKYTGYQFTEFEITGCEKDGSKLAAFRVFETPDPIIFLNPGTYDIGGGKQKTTFSKGTLYFRHGAKSEPGNTDDLRAVIQRRLESIRREWIQGVRKVVQAPPGAEVTVLPTEVVHSNLPGATPIRIVDDPKAPAYRIVDPGNTHPHRQKELIQATNKQLPKEGRINTHDILAVRRVYGIDSKEEFCYKPRFGSPQYSEGLVSWLIEQYNGDRDFFTKARQRYRTGDF